MDARAIRSSFEMKKAPHYMNIKKAEQDDTSVACSENKQPCVLHAGQGHEGLQSPLDHIFLRDDSYYLAFIHNVNPGGKLK